MNVAINDKEFRLFRDLIYDEVGINLTENKKSLLISRLTKRLIALNINSFSDYFEIVSKDSQELLFLLNTISTNMTEFFRESVHFEFLQNGFLKAMRDKAIRTGERKITVWSAASSTGEEAYSIAISILEGLGEDSFWDIKIVASDINTDVLKATETAIYNEESLKKIPKHLWSKYFLKGVDDNGGRYRVKDFIRSMVLTRRFNLMDREWPIRGGFDAVFCRNVLIYFDKKTQEETVKKLCRYLQKGGYFFLGHSETSVGKVDGFKTIIPSIYQKMKD